MTDLDVDALKEATEKAFIYRIIGTPEVADDFGDAIEAIAAMGPRAVHAALSGWSAVTLSAFEQDQGPLPEGGFWSLEVEDTRTGRMVSADETPPEIRDAMRIVACVGNRDGATIAAIVQATWPDPEATAALMCESVRLAAQAANLLAEARDGHDQEGETT